MISEVLTVHSARLARPLVSVSNLGLSVVLLHDQLCTLIVLQTALEAR